MTRPGACDNYSRGCVHASIEGLFSVHSYEQRVSLSRARAHTRVHTHTTVPPTVMILPLASWLAGISRRRRRNVWHSLSQYVTHHPHSHRIGLLRVSSRGARQPRPLWCMQSVWPTTWPYVARPTGCHVITKREIIRVDQTTGCNFLLENPSYTGIAVSFPFSARNFSYCWKACFFFDPIV